MARVTNLVMATTMILASCSDSSFLGTSSKKKHTSTSSPKKPYLDKDGFIRPECKIVTTLPDSPEALTELYNWHAAGATAAFKQVVSTPVVGLLSPHDLVPTIIVSAENSCDGTVATPAYLYAIDGKTGAQKWVSSVQVKNWISAALGDVDGDGNLEVLAVQFDEKLVALDTKGVVKWTSAVPVWDSGSGWRLGVAVADLDGDGKVEVVAGHKVFAGATGVLKFALDAGVADYSMVYEVDGKPGLEIVTSSGIFNGATGAKQCSFAVPVMNPAAARFKAGDTTATIVGIKNDTHEVFGYSGADCHQVFTGTMPVEGGGPINIADFDGDGVLEFGTAGRNAYVTFRADGSVFWKSTTQDYSSNVTGSTTFDFNGDGKNEIVYNDELNLRVFDGATGKVYYETKNSSYTAHEYPVVVDVDGDGTANIVVAANSCPTSTAGTPGANDGVRAFSSPNNNWIKTRPIWNQHAYDPLLVTDAGKLTAVDPSTIFKPFLTSAHLVGFRNNIPLSNIKPECL